MPHPCQGHLNASHVGYCHENEESVKLLGLKIDKDVTFKEPTMLIIRIKTIAMEVFKSLHDLNPNFMKEMFNIK